MVTLEHVLESPPPPVVHAHRVVRRYRPIYKRPVLLAPVLLHKLPERVGLFPPLKDPVLHLREIKLVVYALEHNFLLLRTACSELIIAYPVHRPPAIPHSALRTPHSPFVSAPATS